MSGIIGGMDENVELFVHHRNLSVRGEEKNMSGWVWEEKASEKCRETRMVGPVTWQ